MEVAAGFVVLRRTGAERDTRQLGRVEINPLKCIDAQRHRHTQQSHTCAKKKTSELVSGYESGRKERVARAPALDLTPVRPGVQSRGRFVVLGTGARAQHRLERVERRVKRASHCHRSVPIDRAGREGGGNA